MTTPQEESYPTSETKICCRGNCSHHGEPQSCSNFCKNSPSRDGLNSACRDCVRVEQQQRKQRNIDRLNNGFDMYDTEKTKICSRKDCTHNGVPQPLSNFHKHFASYDLLSPECKTCSYSQSLKWKAANPDKYRGYLEKYHKENKEKVKEYHRNYHAEVKRPKRIENWIETKLSEISIRSEKRGIPFNLEVEDLSPMPTYCSVFGILLDYSSGTNKRSWASVDRIKPSLGYVKGNVRIISLAANMAKFDGEGDITIHSH